VTESSLLIRPFQTEDEDALVALWEMCELTVPWNNPHKDIARKLQVQPELFLVGILDSSLIATMMGGYEGHPGWINYLVVHPDFQGKGLRTGNHEFCGNRTAGNGLSQNQFADSYWKQ